MRCDRPPFNDVVVEASETLIIEIGGKAGNNSNEFFFKIRFERRGKQKTKVPISLIISFSIIHKLIASSFVSFPANIFKSNLRRRQQ